MAEEPKDKAAAEKKAADALKEVRDEVLAAFARADAGNDKDGKFSTTDYSKASEADKLILSVLRHEGVLGEKITPELVQEWLEKESRMQLDSLPFDTADGKEVRVQANTKTRDGQFSTPYRQDTIEIEDINKNGKVENFEFLADNGYTKLRAALADMVEQVKGEDYSQPAKDAGERSGESHVKGE